MNSKIPLMLMSLITLSGCTIPTVPVAQLNDTFLGNYHIIDRRNTYRDYTTYDRVILRRIDNLLMLMYYLPNTHSAAKVVRLYGCVQNTKRSSDILIEDTLNCDYDGNMLQNSSIGFVKVHGTYISKGGGVIDSLIHRDDAMPIKNGYLLNYYGGELRFSLARD